MRRLTGAAASPVSCSLSPRAPAATLGRFPGWQSDDAQFAWRRQHDRAGGFAAPGAYPETEIAQRFLSATIREGGTPSFL